MNILREWKILLQIAQHLTISVSRLLILIFFCAYVTDNFKIVPVEVLAEEIDTNSNKTTLEIIEAAKEKGITEGNALYYYVNATFKESTPNKFYNELKFIGSFNDPE